MDVVAHLLREHYLDLLRREAVQQGVAEQYPAAASQAGQGRIRLACLLAQVQPVDPFDAQARAIGQTAEAVYQCRVFQRVTL